MLSLINSFIYLNVNSAAICRFFLLIKTSKVMTVKDQNNKIMYKKLIFILSNK